MVRYGEDFDVLRMVNVLLFFSLDVPGEQIEEEEDDDNEV